MEPADLARLRAALLRLKDELQQFGAAAGDPDEASDLEQARTGRLSRIEALQAQQMALEAGRRRQRHLALVEGALRRIESGEYGDCFKCGEPIDLRRLAADPTHSRCVRCAED